MKLKVDENGQVALQDGNPIYIHEDGKESPFDAKSAMDKIHALNEECKTHRLKGKDFEEQLKTFEGVDPDKAREAFETLKNLDDKKLIEAKEVETLKKQIGEAHEAKAQELLKSFEIQKGELSQKLEKQDGLIRKLMIGNQFSHSRVVKDQLILPPDIAENFFGQNFKIDEKDGSSRVVGYLNGDKIYSRERPGELADFEEALSSMISVYPQKDLILKGGKPGSGAGGNTSGKAGKLSPEQIAQMSMAEYEQAKKDGLIGV